MPNRQLNAEELLFARELLTEIRAKLEVLSNGDPRLLFAFRRKVFKELMHDERGKPMHRRALKLKKWKEQGGRCAICNRGIEVAESELDRFDAPLGYTLENTQLVHHDCHRKQQAERGFA